MSRRVTFFPKSEWDSDRECLAFRAMIDGRNLRCLVLSEALSELAQERPGSPAATFAENRELIESIARRLLADNAVDDRELVIRRVDVVDERSIPAVTDAAAIEVATAHEQSNGMETSTIAP